MGYQWWIFASLVLLALAHELVEHLGLSGPLGQPFVREFLFFSLVFPIAGVMLALLVSSQSERVRALRRLDVQRELCQQLSNACDWHELAAILVRFPATIIPGAAGSLLVYNQNPTRFELVAEWWPAQAHAPPSHVFFETPDACRRCLSTEPCSLHCLSAGQCPCSRAVGEGYSAYCLPLAHASSPIALLHVYLPLGVWLTESQVELLHSVALVMGLVIDGARPQGSTVFCAELREAERRRIARQLHDTLGQNLAYLRLKLDQLGSQDVLQESAFIQHDLEQMRSVAREACIQVRGTLAGLHSSNSADLAASLLAQANSVAVQAGFNVELTSEGQPGSLSPFRQHQILCLFQEALANVAKHARARNVNIDLTWTAEALIIQLADDGQGFEPHAIRPNGHLGLVIMQERAQEINAQFSLASCPGAGSQVILRVPLHHIPPPLVLAGADQAAVHVESANC